MESPKINLSGISKRFGNTTVLSALTFTLAPGEVTLLLGQNGAGKSTLLKILAGLIHADSGRCDMSTGMTLGYASHEPSLYGQLTVEENLKFFASLLNISNLNSSSLITEWGLQDIVHKKPHALSRGQLAKVGIVRALLAAPQLLILDEPTAFLDTGALEILMQTLSKRTSAHFTIIATHDVERLQKLSHRALHLSDASTISDSKDSSVSNVVDLYLRSNR